MMTTIEQSKWFDARIKDGILVVSVQVSRLDPKLHTKAGYVRFLEEAIAAGHQDIVLDLTKFCYTNHVWGLFQLIFCATYRLNQAGGRLAVCCLGGYPRRTFLFAEMDRHLPDYRSVDAAIRGLKAHAH